jgi:25S rRNA (uracil2634-N3)-methyltransferase
MILECIYIETNVRLFTTLSCLDLVVIGFDADHGGVSFCVVGTTFLSIRDLKTGLVYVRPVRTLKRDWMGRVRELGREWNPIHPNIQKSLSSCHLPPPCNEKQKAAVVSIPIIIQIAGKKMVDDDHSSNHKKKKRPLELHAPSLAAARASATPLSSSLPFPFRDCRGPLYASSATLACALSKNCVPCCYKIGNMDVALDTEFCRAVPNQRPEACPRLTTTTANNSSSSGPVVLGFAATMTVLTIGDGDLTYSVALAVSIGCTVIATSFESLETLEQTYGRETIERNMTIIRSRGGQVIYGVDALNLEGTLPTEYHSGRYDRIIWNFPCAAGADGRDGQNQEMELNKSLIRTFAASAVNFLTNNNGQIHMAHKTKPPFDQWQIEQAVLGSDDNDGDDDGDNDDRPPPPLVYLGRIVLDRAIWPPYVPRKALDRKSFPHHDACTYIFVKTDNNKVNNKTKNKDTNKTMENAGGVVVVATPNKTTDDMLRKSSSSPEQQQQLFATNTVVPVTPDLIQTLRTQFMRRMVAKKNHHHRPQPGKHQTKKKRRKVVAGRNDASMTTTRKTTTSATMK